MVLQIIQELSQLEFAELEEEVLTRFQRRYGLDVKYIVALEFDNGTVQ